jgi:hypothetical protein
MRWRLQTVALAALVLCVASSAAAADQPPANVQVTREGELGHVEPDVAINPSRPANLLGACQFETGRRTRLPGTFTSYDGGRSWHDNGVLSLPAGFEQGADTTVGFDGRGNGFVVALMSHGGGGYASRVERGGVFIWRTQNGGRTFAGPRAVYVGHGFQDHPWLAVRRSGRGTSLYVVWTNDAGLEFAVSRSDGTSFTRPRLVVPGRAPSDPVVTAAGHGLIDIFYEQFSDGNAHISLRVVTSRDDGLHFGRPTLIGAVAGLPNVGGGPKGDDLVPPPLLAAATDVSGTHTAVSIAGEDRQAGHPVIALWEHSDAASGWIGPLRPVTGADARLAQAQPRLLFVGDMLYLSYFAVSRSGESSEHLAYGVFGSAGDRTRVISSRPFHAAGFLGDYQALAAHGPHVDLIWNDRRSGRLEIESARVAIRR